MLGLRDSFEVSVVVAAYNEERYLDRCLRSLVAQSSPDLFEVVLVDDFSDDSTPAIAERFSPFLNLSLLRNEKNLGIGATSAIGVAASSGRFIVRVDADDYVSRSFVQTLFDAISAPGAGPAYRCDYLVVDDQGIVHVRRDADKFPIACGVIMTRESLMEVGLYSSAMRVGEDLEFAGRYLQKFEIQRIPIPLYRYRHHSGNTSGGPGVD